MPPTDPATPVPAPASLAPRPGSTRADPVPLLIVAALLLLARFGFGMFERAPERTPREDQVEWRAPGREAEAEAAATAKPLLYDFSAEWCGPCHSMQDEIFADPRMAAKINALYVPVRVVDRTREEGRNPAEVDALQRLYHVEMFPTLVAASPDGVRHDIHQGYPGSAVTNQWILTAPLRVMKGAAGR